MEEERLHVITNLLSSHEPADLLRGLVLIKAATPQAAPVDAQQFCELILPLFYIDPLDHPEHVPVIEEAIAVTAALGESVIPILIQNLEAGDVKAQMVIAQALGHMGAPAIEPLLAEFQGCPEPGCHNFVLYALGKIKSPEIVKAVPFALGAAASSDTEMRDTATRALGKFAESIPAGGLTGEVCAAIAVRLYRNLSDANPALRSKAVRSLGKLAKYGHLTADERAGLKGTLKRILGEDEHFDWDRAYVVRKEAKEALAYV